MTKEICVLFANCQGEALAPLLLASPEFAARFELRHFLNYRDQELVEHDLKRCSLFLHQYLAPDWGVFSSREALRRLNPASRSVCIPNMFFKGYWPFWTNKTDVINFADSLLEDLLIRGLSPDAVAGLYLKGGLIGDVESVAAASLAREREKERFSDIKYVDIIAQNWRDEPLFITVNHPGKKLLVHAANEILAILGMAPLGAKTIGAYKHPQDEFWLPIHPIVAKKLKLSFVEPGAAYPCFGARISHAEYVSRYLACRAHNISDFVGVLRTLGEKKAGH